MGELTEHGNNPTFVLFFFVLLRLRALASWREILPRKSRVIAPVVVRGAIAAQRVVGYVTVTMATSTSPNARLLWRVRLVLAIFVVALALSGLTAFPLCWETRLLVAWFGPETVVGGMFPALAAWLVYVHQGVAASARDYPFLAYGTDWLAFAHLVIADAFFGPIKDPVRNLWVVEFGMIACLMVIPLALICGPIRGIPLPWRLLDCSFGVLGLVPLGIVRGMILRLGAGEAHR